MTSKDDFQFLNSEIWIKYTQKRYVPVDDIRHRLESLGLNRSEWPSIKEKIIFFRKMGSIPFFNTAMKKNFWLFISDSINEKIHYIEAKGNRLFDKIETHQNFKQEFLSNAAIEEAITSAIYEGANSTRSKAKALIASGDKPKDKDEWMLINNYFAMKWIKENSELPMSKEVILKIHEQVTKNTLEGDDINFSGKFRNDVVYVGKHQGINWELIDESINEIIELTTNNPRYLHPLIKGIILHYFIGYIHPFFDGNGRTARTLFYFKAIKNDLKFVELLSVSASLKERRERYERSFDLVKENQLDITYFIDFCLDSLIDAIDKVEKKVCYLVNISKIQEKDKLTNNQISLLQRMALHKYKSISIELYAEEINKSREIARRELKKLFNLKLLTEKKVGKKFIYFINSKYLKERVREETEG